MPSKILGSVLLIIGTTIGAGMLSLPLVVASCGFITAIILLIISWSVMYMTALRLLNVCAEYPLGVNFTTMLQSRASKAYQIFFSIIYLLLLYALMSAYTTQGAILVNTIGGEISLHSSHIAIPALVFILVFSSFMHSYLVSDYANRFFVFLKFIFFVVAMVVMLFYINVNYLTGAPISILALLFAWPTLLPSFGFHNIIPVLYEYQKGDIKNIRKSIFIGSISVLVIYIVWLLLALSLMPQTGGHSYRYLFEFQNNSLAGFTEQINALAGSKVLEFGLGAFIHLAIITSFIGVGISLMHYIRDMLLKFDIKISNLNVSLLCFFPPLIFTVFYPEGFILALQYAAIFAVVVFIYTPIFLYNKKLKTLKYMNIYALSLGTLVILCQVINLYFNINPFHVI